MLIVQDKTSQIRLENLKEKNDKLKNKNEMARMHASCISHDMRAPLSAIDVMVDMVLNLPCVSDRVVTLLKPVKCTSKILNAQINNLLDFNLMQ
jgi:K+-sensing histidine kinase KdpD